MRWSGGWGRGEPHNMGWSGGWEGDKSHVVSMEFGGTKVDHIHIISVILIQPLFLHLSLCLDQFLNTEPRCPPVGEWPMLCLSLRWGKDWILFLWVVTRGCCLCPDGSV